MTVPPPAAPALDPLLEAARACVLDVGLRRTTLADVARRAGVSRMTVYRAYPDLSAVVSALLTAELLAVVDAARARTAHLPTAREQLVEAAVLVVQDLVVHPLLRRVLDLDPELLLPLVVERFGSTQRAAVQVVAERLVEGRRDGSVRAGDDALDPWLAATCVLLAVQSFVFSARVVEAELGARQEQVGAELRRMLDGYLR